MEQNYKKYIRRCIDIALNGKGYTRTNPMVGCVIVYDDKVIAEGYHQEYGGPHAEVNAINAVTDKELLRKSTLFVSLEPCSHTGKTPPCSDLIVKMQIPKVVIGSRDPNSLVAGKGIEKLRKGGVEVIEGVLSDECMAINNRFFTYHSKRRPYIILKWAQSADGFIDIKRDPDSPVGPNWISNPVSRMLVHKWRAEENAILVGTNTVIFDNPSLTTRLWPGKSPVRVILDRQNRLPKEANVFSRDSKTYICSEVLAENSYNTEYIEVDFSNHPLEQIFCHLWDLNIQSIIVEGGKKVLDSFINQDLWDEARVFEGNSIFSEGIVAPLIKNKKSETFKVFNDTLTIYNNS